MRFLGAPAKEYVSGNKMITFSARLLKVRQKGAAMESREAPRKCNVTGNQEYIKIGNEATSKIATIVHQKR